MKKKAQSKGREPGKGITKQRSQRTQEDEQNENKKVFPRK